MPVTIDWYHYMLSTIVTRSKVNAIFPSVDIITGIKHQPKAIQMIVGLQVKSQLNWDQYSLSSKERFTLILK